MDAETEKREIRRPGTPAAFHRALRREDGGGSAELEVSFLSVLTLRVISS